MIINKKYSLGLLVISCCFSASIIAKEPKKGGALIYLCGEENRNSGYLLRNGN